MLKFTDFKCQSCSHKFEKMVKDEVKTYACLKCGEESLRLIGAPRYFSNTVGKSPSARS